MAPSEHRNGLLLEESHPKPHQISKDSYEWLWLTLKSDTEYTRTGTASCLCFRCFVCVSGKFRCAKNNQLTTAERTQETQLLH